MTRYYLWQDQLKLAAELNGAGQLIKRYVYTNNEHSPDYMLYQGNYFVFIKDHRGSILNVLNARTGQVMQSLKYSDWGKVIQDSNPGYQPFGFAGGMYETDTGLVHFGAREYDPEVGKWISKDPILFEGGDTNLYGYVLNDPMNWVDPSGLIGTEKDEIGVGGSGGGGGSARGAYNPDQRAVIDLAKRAERQGSISRCDAEQLVRWGNEYGIPKSRIDEGHPTRATDFPHLHLGPVNHLPVK